MEIDTNEFIESKIYAYKIVECRYCDERYPYCRKCGKDFSKKDEKIYCGEEDGHLCETCYKKLTGKKE